MRETCSMLTAYKHSMQYLRGKDAGVLGDKVSQGRAGLGLPPALCQHYSPLHQLLHGTHSHDFCLQYPDLLKHSLFAKQLTGSAA